MNLVLIGLIVAFAFAGAVYITSENLISTLLIFTLTISFCFLREKANQQIPK